MKARLLGGARMAPEIPAGFLPPDVMPRFCALMNAAEHRQQALKDEAKAAAARDPVRRLEAMLRIIAAGAKRQRRALRLNSN